MSNSICAVYGCNNSFKNTRVSNPQVQFYKFSKKEWQQERMKKWISFVKRKGVDGKLWLPTSNSVICSTHFVGNKKSEHPHHPSYIPSIRNTCVQPKTEDRFNRAIKRKKTVHSVVTPDLNITCDIISTEQQQLSTNLSTNDVALETEKEDNLRVASESQEIISDLSDAESYSLEITPAVVKSPSPATEPQGIPIQRTHSFRGFDSVKTNEAKLKSLTGVSMNVFSLLLRLIPPTISTKYGLSSENRLLICLIKLKSNLPYSFIATLFDVSPATVSNVFTSILTVLCSATKEWIIWPSKYAVKATMPQSFKTEYPNCRVILDCTEIKCERPSGVHRQVLMYSHYKGTWTVKFLVGICPNGFISFVSKGFGGRATDTQITNQCGILNKLEPGDIVMSDKGFPNITMVNNTILVMPPFSRNKMQFSETQMTETYKVASVRIHVERAIQRLKIFNILATIITNDLFPYIDEIIHICAVLVNLQSPIIKPT